jgi:hypothetical protein
MVDVLCFHQTHPPIAKQHMSRAGQNQSFVCIHGLFTITSREISKHTVIHGECMQFWPVLHIKATNLHSGQGRVQSQTLPVQR